MARLQGHYSDNVVKQMIDQHSYKSVMEVPRIEKITLNIGLGEAVGDKKVLENALSDMTQISGQKPVCDGGEKVHRWFQDS